MGAAAHIRRCHDIVRDGHDCRHTTLVAVGHFGPCGLRDAMGEECAYVKKR